MKIFIFVISLIFLEVSGQEQIECWVHGSKCNFQGLLIGKNEDVTIRVKPRSADLKKIQEVDISSSSIHSIPPEIFSTFPNLKILKIFAQNVQEIGTKTFQNATKLERLELDYNKLTRLDQRAFEGAENLKFLYLHSNNIDLIEEGAFEGSW